MTASSGAHPRDRVYRIHWLPGTDTLHGTCHCGAERVADEPVELWEWLLGHPDGHQRPEPATRSAPRSPAAARAATAAPPSTVAPDHTAVPA
ncbi:hypothetical protein [Micromonospora sp. NBC_01813]|uniref:hypothetical protein n=1 Tax=Micromonospora sp. NBC_01813 TaxID=2975988 RepID=UPI002DD8BE8C|nr:hypothetical protein [Micromonospora sp. NBC_01813]WSA10187.1 hypothetical protein OG958_05155 [Micromonospora sp. NBC_01813]